VNYALLFVAAFISFAGTFVLCAVIASRNSAMSAEDADAMARIQAGGEK
jgi:hypothetical protein